MLTGLMATVGPKKRVRRDRRDELVEVSARLFRERGYEATSMQDIADALGILKGSLYHYVGTKEDLLWMIMQVPLTELVETAERIFSDRSDPWLARIRRAIIAHCESFERYDPHMFVITREHGETLSTGLQKELLALQSRYRDVWKRAIEGGRHDGELRSDLDPTVVVEAIFGMVNWMFRWFQPGGRLSAVAVGEQFSSMLESGIRA